MKKRLYRTEGPDAKLFGVCGGVAEYFEVDPTLVRVGWVILAFAGSLGVDREVGGFAKLDP